MEIIRFNTLWFKKYTYLFNSSLILLLLMIFSLSLLSPVTAEQEKEELLIGIDEKLGKQAVLNYTFLTAEKDTVNLAKLIDRPTILSFVYFKCPGICTPLLGGLLDVVDQVKLEPGTDFQVITISMNKDEGPALALKKKENYLKGSKRNFPLQHWWWLTGDSANIQGATESLGFKFKRMDKGYQINDGTLTMMKENNVPPNVIQKLKALDGRTFEEETKFITALENMLGKGLSLQFRAPILEHAHVVDFAHPAAIMALSEEGKIARYLHGITFNPFDLKMAIMEASEGRSGPSVAKVIKFCFSYDPEGRGYVFNFMKVGASLVLLFAAVFVITITLRKKKDKKG